MELEERFGVRTSKDLVDSIGLSNLACFVPFGIDELKAAYSKDKYFNNLPLVTWDKAAGFICEGGKVVMIGSPLLFFLREKYDVSCFSCSSCVSLLKEVARQIIGED